MMKNWSSRKVVIAPRHLDNLERIAKENQFESLSETIDWVLTDWHRWVNGLNNKNIIVQPSAMNSMSENKNDDFTNKSSTDNESSKWVDNQGDEVKNVFGFNSSAELVNGRAAMIGFLMLILTAVSYTHLTLPTIRSV